MGYASLSLGIIFAIFAQMCVKMSKGFKVLLPTLTAFILFIFTNFFISSAIRYFEMGIVYAVWSALTIIYDSRSEEHTSELQSRFDLVCRLLLEKKKVTMSATLSAVIMI